MENCKVSTINLYSEEVQYTDKNTNERKSFLSCGIFVNFDNYRAVRIPLSLKSASDKWLFALAKSNSDVHFSVVQQSIPYTDKVTGEKKSFVVYRLSVKMKDYPAAELPIVVNSDSDKFFLDSCIDPNLLKRK